MSTYIQVFKSKSRYSKLYMIICIGFVLIGITGLLVSFLLELSFIPFLNEGGYYALLFNGLISFLIVWDSLRKVKYFVSWNNKEISYFLPKTENPETIDINSIKTVDNNRNKIIIGLESGETKHFNLNYFFFPERQTIINFFEGLKK